jgi:hypothetical protein
MLSIANKTIMLAVVMLTAVKISAVAPYNDAIK